MKIFGFFVQITDLYVKPSDYLLGDFLQSFVFEYKQSVFPSAGQKRIYFLYYRCFARFVNKLLLRLQ